MVRPAVVLGASGGVGRHLAIRLAEEGWAVTATGRRPADAVELPDGISYLRADLAQRETLPALAAHLARTRPELIVHNAASYGAPDDARPSLDDIETLFRINALLPYRLLLEYLTDLPADRFCSCIVVNSDSIYHASEQTGVYAASKAALRVLTTALANACRPLNASASTLLLGPLADPRKLAELDRLARRRGVATGEITRLFLRKSNPSFVIESLIDFESCFRSIEYLAGLGRAANGMLCKLDGGSSGSLV